MNNDVILRFPDDETRQDFIKAFDNGISNAIYDAMDTEGTIVHRQIKRLDLDPPMILMDTEKYTDEPIDEPPRPDPDALRYHELVSIPKEKRTEDETKELVQLARKLSE